MGKSSDEIRVAVTGLGILSCIGNSKEEVTRSLQQGRSGIVRDDLRVEKGFRSPLTGKIRNFSPKDLGLKRKQMRTMCEPALYACSAVTDAIADAGLEPKDLESSRCGIVFGNDSTVKAGVECLDTAREYNGTHNIGTGSIFKLMNSTITMNLAQIFKIKGANWTVSSACSSGSNALGQAYMLIKSGLQDIVLSGGAQETNWMSVAGFDSLGAFSTHPDPAKACRPFDAARDGLVPSGGGASLVVENLDHARKRGARIYGIIQGYGFSSQIGANLSESNAEGVGLAIENALISARIGADQIDYINAHATSTLSGDRIEAMAIHNIFGNRVPVSSTKSMTGHECWMSGASEAVYTILMAHHGFLAPNVNFHGFEPDFPEINIVKEARDHTINHAISNSFGFGGTNAAVVFDFRENP
jgi:3-oxoacyl-[acyl-carrier-protein] synthase-1